LTRLNQVPDGLTLFVLDAQEKLVGTLTDGDIRRGLLDNIPTSACARDFMFTQFRYLDIKGYGLKDVEELKLQRIKLLPILNEEKHIVRIVDLSKKRSLLPIDAVIMAGGKGMRLRPMTEHTPKPLLRIGDKPIMEYNIDRLSLYGVYNLTITIKYLGEQIRQRFGDGSPKGMNIRYVAEEQPLGTIGAVGQIKEFANDYVLVMNSDLLTNIDYEGFFKELVENRGDMIVATAPYEVKIPYGVIETKGEAISALKEKPSYTYYSNAGIYIFKREYVHLIPKDKEFNATDLMELLIDQGKKVLHYPILDYWLDIGKPEDFEKALKDIKHINF